jgi:hypothetical protein
LHTLPGQAGGVINVFNLAEETQEIRFTVPRARLNANHDLGVCRATAIWSADEVEFRLFLEGLTPAVVLIGEIMDQYRSVGLLWRIGRYSEH